MGDFPMKINSKSLQKISFVRSPGRWDGVGGW